MQLRAWFADLPSGRPSRLVEACVVCTRHHLNIPPICLAAAAAFVSLDPSSAWRSCRVGVGRAKFGSLGAAISASPRYLLPLHFLVGSCHLPHPWSRQAPILIAGHRAQRIAIHRHRARCVLCTRRSSARVEHEGGQHGREHLVDYEGAPPPPRRH